MDSKLIVCLFILLGHQSKVALGGTYPLIPKGRVSSSQSDDIPLDTSSLPKEILEQLDDDEIVEEIVVVEEDKKQVIDLRNDTTSAGPIPIQPEDEEKLLRDIYKTVMADLKETPRSVDMRPILEALKDERTGAFFRENNFSKDKLLSFLTKTQGLQNAVPLNRQSILLEGELKEPEPISSDLGGEEDDPSGFANENGIRCIPKVIHIDETVYERGMKCHHSYQKKCHMTYITDYAASNEQKCDTSFKKNCHITFKPVPTSEKVNICHTPLVRKCDSVIKGPEICSTQYEDNCETKFKTYQIDQDRPKCKMVEKVRCTNVTVELFHLHAPKEKDFGDDDSEPPFAVREKCEKWPVQECRLIRETVTKVHPETSCEKIPRHICIPSNCITVKGKEVCHEEMRTAVQNLPQEDCDLQPEQNCRIESTLVPRLVPKNNCLKVPKEVCVNTKKNPKVISKPIVKQWCYKPDDLDHETIHF